MAYLNTPKDILAEHVKQLLVMDEDTQRAQLAQFSTYAAVQNSPTEQMKGAEESTNMGYAWPEAGSSASTSICGGSDSGREPPHSADSAESSESEGQTKCPAKVGAPPGLDIDPSLASDMAKQHLMGTCSPCAYFYLKADGCRWGEDCQFCHLCPEDEIKKRKKQLKKLKKQSFKEKPLGEKDAEELASATEPSLSSAQSDVSTASQQPEYVTDLKAAKAQTAKQDPLYVPLPPSMPAQGNVLTDAIAAQQPSAAALNVLKQAVNDLSGIVPEDEAEAAKAAQKFFQAELQRLQAKREFECRQAEAQRHQQEFASAISKQSSQTGALHAMKLMQQQLNQLSQKMDNIIKAQEPILQQAYPTSTPWNPSANCFVPGAGVGDGAGMWPPAPLGPFAGQPPFPAATAQPVVASFVMPWEEPEEAMPVDSRPPGVNLPSGSRPPGVNFPKQFVPPHAGGQGANQPYGAMPATKGATGPGVKGKAYYRQKAVPADEPLFDDLSQQEKVVLVRKINRLGFESIAALEAHYSRFGKVERVVVPHFHRCRSTRLRPSGLGFVVMSEKEEVDAILSMGEEQIVGGVVIKVQRFQRLPAADQDNELDVE